MNLYIIFRLVLIAQQFFWDFHSIHIHIFCFHSIRIIFLEPAASPQKKEHFQKFISQKNDRKKIWWGFLHYTQNLMGNQNKIILFTEKFFWKKFNFRFRVFFGIFDQKYPKIKLSRKIPKQFNVKDFWPPMYIFLEKISQNLLLFFIVICK